MVYPRADVLHRISAKVGGVRLHFLLCNSAGTITAGMITAGLNALTSQAIVTLASNKGDIDKTLNDLNKSDTLKSVAVAMSVAGLVGGGSLKNASFAQHLTHQAIRMSAQMGVESAIHGRTDGRSAGLTAIASSLCGYFSNQIGSAYTKGDFGYFTHKFLHALSGAAGGAIIDGKEGAIAGAVGAAGVEVIADFMSPTGGMANDPNRAHYTDEQIQHTKDAARFTIILLGLAAGLNAKQLSVELALATVAIENNFEQSARYLGAEGTEPEEESSDKKTTKQSTRADEVEIDAAHYLGANQDEDDYFITHEKHFRAWNAEKRELESQLRDARLAYEKGESGSTVKHTKIQGSLTLHKVMRPVSPPRATMIRKTVGELEERYVLQSVKSEMRNFSGALGDCRVEVDASWNDFKKNPSLQTWNDLALGSKVGFETLDLLGAGVQKTLSAVRQVLRATGVSADTAQDSVWIAERIVDAYTLGKGGTSLAGKLTSTAGTGAKVKNVTMLNANRLGSLDDLTIGRTSNGNVTRVNQFDRMTHRNPANHTSLARNHSRATGGGNSVTSDFTMMSDGTHLVSQTRVQTHKAGAITSIKMSGGAPKTVLPAKDSVITYGHVQDSTGKLIEAAIGVKGKTSGILSITKPKTGLLEGANEASAAYKRVQANMASPTSVAVDVVNQAPYNPRAMEHLMHETYGAGNVTSSTLLASNERMVHMAGKTHPVTGIPYDLKGNPIFDSVAAFDVKLPSDWALSVKAGTHKSAATRELAKAIESNPTLKAKFDSVQLQDIALGEKTIEGYIWHHHQDIGRMQLIPAFEHIKTGHTGEDLWTRGLNNAK